MNENIRTHLTAHNIKNGWGTSDKDLFETIKESNKIYREEGSEHRWYIDEFCVVEVDGMFIGFNDFKITGDNSASDMGLEHDLTSICEVEKKTKTIEYYSRK